MNTVYSELLRVASALEASDLLSASQLRYHVSRMVPGSAIKSSWFFAANADNKGGRDEFVKKIKHLVETMQEAKDQLENSLTEDDQAFLTFYDGGGKEDIESSFADVDALLNVASCITRAASTTRYAEGFAEFFKSVKDDLLGGEGAEFFQGAEDVLKQLEDAKKNPGDQELVNGLVAQLEEFINQGNELLNKAVEFGDEDINPEGIGITLEGDQDYEDVDAKGVEVDLEDQAEPADLHARGELEGYELERVVSHYVDMLQKALADQDSGAITKFLKELFEETRTNVEEEKVSVAAKRALRARLLPVLTRLAFKRAHLRPLLVPYLRVAAKNSLALGLGKKMPFEVVKVHGGGYEELRGGFNDEDSARAQLAEVKAEGDTKDAYIKHKGERLPDADSGAGEIEFG